MTKRMKAVKEKLQANKKAGGHNLSQDLGIPRKAEDLEAC